MSYICPVCGYPELEAPPENFEICACCGTEFALDDDTKSHKQLMGEWILNDTPWFSDDTPKPWGWSAFAQLSAAGLIGPITISHSVVSERTIHVPGVAIPRLPVHA